METIRTLLLLAAALFTAPACAQPGPLQRIEVSGLTRTYILNRVHPDQAAGRLPVIIYLHGSGTLVTEGVPPRFDIRFDDMPGMAPALIVRPQGVNRHWDSVPAAIPTWQRLSGTNGEPVDDIGFLRALIDRLVVDENADPARIYVAGVSSGGYLVPRIACEMGDKVAAVADVIATSRQAVFRHCDAPPVAVAILASTTDDTNPYAGSFGNELTRLASAPDTAAFFARHNGCTARTENPLPHTASNDSTVSLIRFSECRGGTEVLFYRVDGSGHSVPSKAPVETSGWEATGRRNRDMDTAETLWAFFQTHRRVAP